MIHLKCPFAKVVRMIVGTPLGIGTTESKIQSICNQHLHLELGGITITLIKGRQIDVVHGLDLGDNLMVISSTMKTIIQMKL